jgi:Papain family cysteine protease
MRTNWLALMLWFASGALNVQAQRVADDDYSNQGEGAIPATKEDLEGIPVTPKYREFLPERIDLSARFPVPGDQGNQGSCVGWAVGYAARSYYARTAEGRNTSNAANIPSPAYIYGSILADHSYCDAGSKIPDALKLLRTGALSLREFPYLDTQCRAPSYDQRARASDFKINGFHIVNYKDVDQVKGELARGNPVIILITEGRAFHNLKANQIYRARENNGGNHAVTVVGYDEEKQAFKLINSWGRGWSAMGFGWVGYDVFRDQVHEAYVMRVDRSEPHSPPSPKPEVVVVPHPPPPPEPEVVVVLNPPELVSELDCAKVRVNEKDGKRVLTGFVGSDEDLARLRTAAPMDDFKVTVRPWPQCEALLTLDQSLSKADRPTVRIRRTSGDTLMAGDHLVFEIETPAFPSYVHVAYFQADGSVLNLVQPGIDSFTTFRSGSKIVIGESEAGSQRFRVSGPFGPEMLVVLAARSPIFPEARPKQETERDFLTALRRSLIWKENPAAPNRDVVAAFDAIVTKGRGTP